MTDHAEEEYLDLLRAIFETLDVPNGDEPMGIVDPQERDRAIARRAMRVTTALESTLGGRPPSWSAEFLRRK